KGMESGHRVFLAGVGLSLLGLLVAIPAMFVLDLGLAYTGVALSVAGFILFVLGIHIFMRETTVEVRHILGLPSPNQTAVRAPAPPENAVPRRLGVSERILIMIVVASLLFTVLLFLIR